MVGSLKNQLYNNNLTLVNIKSKKKDYIFVQSEYGIHEVRVCSLKLENELKNKYKDYKYKPMKHFNGFHECFDVEILNKLKI